MLPIEIGEQLDDISRVTVLFQFIYIGFCWEDNRLESF